LCCLRPASPLLPQERSSSFLPPLFVATA
jgi:hypothetical protein